MSEETRQEAGAPAEEPRPEQAEVIEDAEVVEEPAGSEEAVEADLDALLADVKRERDEYLQLAQRARADFENFRKRAARDAADAERRGKAGVVRDLVPVVDNLERALESAGDDAGALAEGVALVLKDLREALGRAGVEAYDPRGERFDPNFHEALSTRPAEDGLESGTVAETLQKGYRLDEQVLRPARVVVVG